MLEFHKMPFRIANEDDSDLDIKGFFARQLVFEIFENLLYLFPVCRIFHASFSLKSPVNDAKTTETTSTKFFELNYSLYTGIFRYVSCYNNKINNVLNIKLKLFSYPSVST